MQETGVRSLGGEDLLEKEMATHPSLLAWAISRYRGAWLTTVHGFAKSWTWLKQLRKTCKGMVHSWERKRNRPNKQTNPPNHDRVFGDSEKAKLKRHEVLFKTFLLGPWLPRCKYFSYKMVRESGIPWLAVYVFVDGWVEMIPPFLAAVVPQLLWKNTTDFGIYATCFIMSLLPDIRPTQNCFFSSTASMNW